MCEHALRAEDHTLIAESVPEHGGGHAKEVVTDHDGASTRAPAASTDVTPPEVPAG